MCGVREGQPVLEESTMKVLLSFLALGIAVAFTAPAFAADAPKTKADCEKTMNMKWDATAKACVKK
jgi:hypothetical protein